MERNKISLKILLLMIIGSAWTHKIDQLHRSCPVNMSSKWPLDVTEKDLSFMINENVNNKSPIYQITFKADLEDEISALKPNTHYTFELKSNSEVSLIRRFLISIVSISESNGKCSKPGRLESLSDESQHLGYSCTRYLTERPTIDPKRITDYTSVPFTWVSPKCGCIELSAQVMDSGKTLFQFDNDPQKALQLKLCVEEQQNFEIDDAHVEMNMTDYSNEEEENVSAEFEYQEDEEDEHEHEDEEEEDEVEDYAVRRKGPKKWKRKIRKGKRHCCNKGHRISLKKENCQKIPKRFIKRISNKFGTGKNTCTQLFQECCTQNVPFKKYRRRKRQQRRREGRKNQQNQK